MAKPILIIEFPENTVPLPEQRDSIISKINDYHVFFISNKGIDKIEFKCFYDKDFTESDFDEIKSYILNKMGVKPEPDEPMQ